MPVGQLGVLRVSVPGQLSITGFDDIPFARYTTPPLTTASIPKTSWAGRRGTGCGR
ncbi:substrate-binding domain-containing protein [Phytohabitans houttuyneae]|uniref:substrate-binding domain-containing protein n=1 Tax=Phytohabitans houttuyneae TaxID=1076126 RepID=UPI001FE4E942|nr:substrate-binding domain-containing protein [Phytohabitans houttuyneae]